jgi:D-glycero-D-manno-heptose 1,7-bisphosphate phosphatase
LASISYESQRRWPLPEVRALRPAVFLDRDGTVSEEVGYLNHLSRFRMLSGVAAAIRKLNDARLPVVVVTNQSGVGRGYFPESLVREVHERMLCELAAEGARLDGVYYCPHVGADECSCRKPKTGMLERAASELRLDLRKSFVVGDRGGDVATAHRAGCKSVLVRTGFGEGELAWHAARWPQQPDFVAKDLAEAVEWILGEAQQ